MLLSHIQHLHEWEYCYRGDYICHHNNCIICYWIYLSYLPQKVWCVLQIFIYNKQSPFIQEIHVYWVWLGKQIPNFSLKKFPKPYGNWVLTPPPRFFTKNSIAFGAKKFPQTLWIGRDPPPPYGKFP